MNRRAAKLWSAQSRPLSSRAAWRLRGGVVGILGGVLMLAGCGQQGQRLVRLATFEMTTEDAEGRIFMALVCAYYEIEPGNHADPVPGSTTPGDYPAQFFERGTSAEEDLALQALVRIQAIDNSELLPTPALLASWETKDYWEHLTTRSQRAFRDYFAKSVPAK